MWLGRQELNKIRLIVLVAVIVIATLQEQAVALATGKLKVVVDVVVNQQ